MTASAAEQHDPARRRRRNRFTIATIFLVSSAPIVAALVAYFLLPPTGRTNYGELIEPQRLPLATMQRLDGSPFTLEQLRGKWVMVHADSGACEAACQAKLFNMRQVRLAQGQNMERIERVWLLVDDRAPTSVPAALYDGVIIARGGAALIAAMPAAQVGDHIFLVDPRGFVMLRFPKDADPKRMIKDLERLLKYSGAG
jgi:cytochrome oxidase Cu insertion factor (SCO1/SenC/PrrC family)